MGNDFVDVEKEREFARNVISESIEKSYTNGEITKEKYERVLNLIKK